MRMSFVAAMAVVVAVASPLHAQGMAGMNMDPTKAIKGSGTLPAGWSMRFDPIRVAAGRPAPAPHAITEIDFRPMGPGLHISTGPAAIYYRAADAAKGDYTVSVSLSQRKGMEHEAYGLFVGGNNLQDSTQSYLYFVIRPMDGGILINYRSSDARPKALVAWTPDPAINKDDPKDGHATNVLAIHVGKDAVDFMANGKTVKSIPRSELAGINTDGVVGLRVNHNLDLHIADFELKK
ncbi:MAG: hypothetical protein ABJE47_23010 [bacterium]